MLSTSPDHSTAASPPGPPSSQSSSVGSCFTSESSRASFQARPTLSDPSSSSTSPASTYERSSEQPYATAHVKRPTQSTNKYNSPSSNAVYPSGTHYSSETAASQHSRASLASPRGDHTRPRAMQPPASGFRDGGDLNAYHRAGSSTNVATESLHVARDPQSFDSPDNHRGPAPKARRTSPGGSRASGSLDPSHDAAQYNHNNASSFSPAHHSRSPHTSSSATLTSQTPSSSTTPHPIGSSAVATAWANTAATSRPPDAVAGSQSYQPWQAAQASQASQAPSSAYPSPRTRVDNGPTDVAPPPSNAESSVMTMASPHPSSSSTTDRSDGQSRIKQTMPPSLPKMDLATFAPQELLKILATLLHEIATANDEFQPDGSKDESSRGKRGARSRDRSAPATPAEPSSAASGSSMRDYTAPPGSHLSFNDSRRPSVTTAALGALATPSSTLCFHARNVPSISIESYLLRILKYCPTTNEVFLSLLVYFDRMSRMGTGAKPGANGEGEVAGEAAGLPRASERATGQSSGLGQDAASTARQSDGENDKEAQPYTHPGIRGFAIDSYNVHRLVIAGVTVASKFFSDVFYTNSRYAKVGGLPPHELNQLELQFLLLNDFRLTIPLEEMQRYADQLLMYASGRPEMAKLTKPISISTSTSGIASDGSSASASATPVATKPEPGASKATMSMDTSNSSDASEIAPSSSTAVHHANPDAQGDVAMSDAQR